MAALHSDPSFDRELRRSLAVVDRGAADVGDVLEVARRVSAGDIGGWEREWQRTADRALGRGDELLGGDDLDGACRAFLRAAEYYRQAGVFSDGESRHTLDTAHVNAFRAAMPLLPVVAEIVEIVALTAVDGEPNRLRGYLFRSAGDGNRPLALAIVGSDSTAEACYAEVAMPVIDRGVDCLILHPPVGRPRHDARRAAARWIADRADLNRAPLLLVDSDPFGDELTGVAEAQPLTAGPVSLEPGGVQPSP
jgi:hypothetical protein